MPGVGDARLAVYAASSLPAWLWTTDGTRVLWANPVGAQVFGAKSAALLAAKHFGPADPHRRQVAALASRLSADEPPRLERLRGFGAALGGLMTCACTHLVLADKTNAMLVVGLEAIGKIMPLSQRLQSLVEDSELPMAAFGSDGVFVGASQAARALSAFRRLSEAGLDGIRETALREGRAETPIGVGRLVLQRVGHGADIGLVAMLEPSAIASLPPVPAIEKDAPPPPVEPSALFAPFDNDPELASNPISEETASVSAATPEPAPASEPSEPSPEISELPTYAIEPIAARSTPLRFTWTLDADGHLAIQSEELEHLLGIGSAVGPGFEWQSIAASGIDAGGNFGAAVASHSVWSGVRVALPVEGLQGGLPAELSGLPLFGAGGFAGYRGFGICHDLPALTHLQALRDAESHRSPAPRSLSAHSAVAVPFEFPLEAGDMVLPSEPSSPPTESWQGLPATDAELAASNIASARSQAEAALPALTPVESNAFDELARELSARLEHDVASRPATEMSVALHTEGAEPDASPEFPLRAMYPLLDAITDALLIVDRSGSIEFANRAAAAIVGNASLPNARIGDLLEQESADRVHAMLTSLTQPSATTHEVRLQDGASLTLRLTSAPGSLLCLLLDAVTAPPQTANAVDDQDTTATRSPRSPILPRVSDELRPPLTAIIGFADAMADHRFGPLGDPRYTEIAKDIRGSAERAVLVLDDVFELTSVESGNRELEFARQDLNDIVEQCVASMQPQANRQRVIIRSSLAHGVPTILADRRALHQIVINLIGNSIRLAYPGGQVIVSTATSPEGEVMLRLRDSGQGHNDNDAGSALGPTPTKDETEEPAAVRLALTRALIEANRGRFTMKAASYAGTLIEIGFSPDGARP